MARKMVLVSHDQSPRVMLMEGLAQDEAQLQELVKDHPDLLPIDEFGMTGPLLVIGRETPLPSGAVDLLAIARGGELLVVEFKTGPQNADFRQALAQLLDYGSDLWQMPLNQLEANVAIRYFGGDRCRDPRLRGMPSLDAAAHAVWPDLSVEEESSLRDKLTQQLESGALHYVVVAQRFVPTIKRTVEYLNVVTAAARFYAVELVRFVGDGHDAFEARTILTPSDRNVGPREIIDEVKFLAGFGDEDYRRALREILDRCRSLGFRLEWGTVGTSIRLLVPGERGLLTLGWLFPAGGIGWMGLSDLTLGYDPSAAKRFPSVVPVLEDYVADIGQLEGAQAEGRGGLRAFRFGPDAVMRAKNQLTDLLAGIIQRVNG